MSGSLRNNIQNRLDQLDRERREFDNSNGVFAAPPNSARKVYDARFHQQKFDVLKSGTSGTKSQINDYYQTIVVCSANRDKSRWPQASEYVVSLPSLITNVTGLSLVHAHVPCDSAGGIVGLDLGELNSEVLVAGADASIKQLFCHLVADPANSACVVSSISHPSTRSGQSHPKTIRALHVRLTMADGEPLPEDCAWGMSDHTLVFRVHRQYSSASTKGADGIMTKGF